MKFKAVKISILAISIVSLLSSVVFADTSINNFIKQKDYTLGVYTDVNSTAWYANDVQTMYELGLMGGKGAGQFDPNGNLLVAETISMVARLHNIYNGGTGDVPASGSNWYDGSVAYCLENGIIKNADFSTYTSKITRAQMAYLFASVLPESEYTRINDITSLPDVNASTKYSTSIFSLYNAGIVGGSDSKGTFKPDSNIIRAEAAAIIKRVVQPNIRKKVTFASETPPVVSNGYLDGFDFNGKYYPLPYWNGATVEEARETFLQNRKLKPIYVPEDGSYVMDDAWRLGIQSESVYQLVVKEITAKYPIITKGTVAEISTRQEQQLLALAGWLREHTYYSYERNQAPGDFNMSWIYSYNTTSDIATYRSKLDSGRFATGVCEDYAKTFEIAAKLMGIDAMYVVSYNNPEGHAWNVVRMANDKIFYFDTTNIDNTDNMLFGKVWQGNLDSVYGNENAYDFNVTSTSKRLWATVDYHVFYVDLAGTGDRPLLPAGSAYGTLDEWWSMFNKWSAEYPIRENFPPNYDY